MTDVIVPFYDLSPQRKLNLDLVLLHLVSRADLDPISAAGGVSPGDARNRSVKITTGPILLFNDADSICPPDQIREAIRLAGEEPGLVFAYDLYLRLQKDAVHEGAISYGRVEREIFNSGSMACVAISRECFERVGGFNESYVGWGYEDLDFARRCDELWPIRRVPGPVYHLWHGDRRDDGSPEDSDPGQVRANQARWAGSTA
jgi:hypothetical protein